MHPFPTDKNNPSPNPSWKILFAGSAHVLLDVQFFFATYLDFGILAR